jgi:hypothetical protein
MTFEDRVRGVQALGFTARQARFLATVALHSGYCLRRQYVAFAGVRYGQNVRDFLDSLVERQVAERFSLRADRGYVYHLHARTIYRALRQEDNRNRRDASAALMARKIMLLDYVLAHGDVDWLAAEEDKVELFECFGVPRGDFPQRVYAAAQPGVESTTRYFPHKLPVCLAGDPPVVHFVYLAAEDSGRSLEPFLQDHAALLRRLPAWTVVALAPRTSAAFVDCERVFARFVEQPTARLAGKSDDLRWFLGTRQIVDRGELARLSVADINRFRTLREQFSASTFEALYKDWLVRGDQVFAMTDSTTSRPTVSGVGRLVTEVLPFDYSQFGALPGVA